MTITKTLEIKANGRTVEIQIEKTRELQDDISFADGWNINHGKKTVELTYITIKIDGVIKEKTHSVPFKIWKNDPLRAKGAHGCVGDTYFGVDSYNKIMALIAEIDAELEAAETEEYAEVKAQEIAEEATKAAKIEKEIAEYEKLIESGMCPKCGSWCYGDCELSR